jgi:hypothetical protein
MVRRVVTFGGISILLAAPLLADFSYQQKSTITGGVMASARKVAGVFSKAAREPMVATVAVKGDKMAHRSATHLQIIDLGSETITSVDLQKKTYSSMTFAQMKQMLEQAQQKMQKKSDGPDVKFKVSAEKTGATKTIGGFDAKEALIKIEMESNDPQSGQSGAMIVTTDAWFAPAAAGYQEIQDFHKRMAEKLDWAPGSNIFAGRVDVQKGMAESMKQLGAMEGMVVYEVVSMGAAGGPSGQAGAQPQPKQQQSAGGMLGSALGGKFGLGRKKQQQPPPEQQPAEQAPAGTPGGVPNGLMEMTVEMSNFSGVPVDGAQFEIPAGFKKVEGDMRRGMQ